MFLVNGSPEERSRDIEDMIEGDPDIVLCSVQDTLHGLGTIQYFAKNGYRLYGHWLNPGHGRANAAPDSLNLAGAFSARGAQLLVRDGRKPVTPRVRSIRNLLITWVTA